MNFDGLSSLWLRNVTTYDATQKYMLICQKDDKRGNPSIRNCVRELLGVRADALARKFATTHDMQVRDEIERLLKDYGKLKEPWKFVAS